MRDARNTDPEDRAFTDVAFRRATVTVKKDGGIAVGGGRSGPVDEADVHRIQRAYRGADAAGCAGHNVWLGGMCPRGFTVFPADAGHDTFEHRHIVVTPLAAGGWDFSLRAPDRHLSDGAEPYVMPQDETMPGLFDDEMPETLQALARRHFGGG